MAISESLSRPAIVMPAMSPFLNEATVSRWKKKEGESFVAGEPIVQIESDIATIDIVAESPGILGQILIPDGTRNVPVQKIMAIVARNAEELALMRRPASPAFVHRARTSSLPPVRSPSPTPSRLVTVERPLLMSSMNHRPSPSETQPSMSRGMATTPNMSAAHAVDGASLRRKIVASMAQSSCFSSTKKSSDEYFDGII
ncbi:single hybrid motif-containing protein [Hymenopellis radicata]|nr:single hybrid motif-containing protein [Hymenopellis radicata]